MELWNQTPGLCEEVPALTYYPAPRKQTSATVVIFPGGGYAHRAVHEGKGYAEYLNSIGMDAFVLDYRVKPHTFPLPLLDARRALRFVRHHAEKYGIDPARVAVMGSSAGGHLAALVSTYTAPIDFEGMDEIDRENCLPNAQILCYPVITSIPEITHTGSFCALTGSDNPADWTGFSAETLVNDTTPPAFLWHTAADDCVNVNNSYRYASALRAHNIPHELHVFPFGGHGLGLATGKPHVAQWAGLLRNWFILMGWLQEPTEQ